VFHSLITHYIKRKRKCQIFIVLCRANSLHVFNIFNKQANLRLCCPKTEASGQILASVLWLKTSDIGDLSLGKSQGISILPLFWG
jgi:hypothetical protein